MKTGRWITGEKGTHRLIQLRNEVDKKDLSLAPLFFEKKPSYSPWMSSNLLRDRVKSWERVPEALLNLNENPQPILDDKALSDIHNFFVSDGEVGLEAIGTETNRNIRVADPSNDWLNVSRRLFPAAISLIKDTRSTFDDRISGLCQCIIPLVPTDITAGRSKQGRGFSTQYFRGGIFLDPPDINEFQLDELIINIAHELGHQALIVYQTADKIIEGDPHFPIYSVIRKTERPAILSLHAVVASAYMAEMLEIIRENEHYSMARKEYLSLRLEENINLVRLGLSSLKAVSFTKLGKSICHELQDLIDNIR